MWIEVLVELILWLLAFLFLGRIRRLPEGAEPGTEIPVSVIIPARNEEDKLATLLESLQEQTLAPEEIIVVDDYSEDRTAEIAVAFGARVEQPAEEAADWLGKPRACWSGAQAATGSLLLFLDADTSLAPEALARLTAAHRRYGGLISVQPFHAMQRPYERLSAFFNIVLMGALRSFTLLGSRLQPHGSFGPCLVCSAGDYHRTGGHSLVKYEVLEDVALGRAMADRGVALRNFTGKEVVRFRMYPGGVREVANGWTKNFARGAMTTGPVLLIMLSAWIIGSGISAGYLGALAIEGWNSHTALGLGFYGAYVLQLWWLLRRIGNFGFLSALIYPLHLAFFAAVFLRSLYFTLFRRSVTWKGRQIPIHRRE